MNLCHLRKSFHTQDNKNSPPWLPYVRVFSFHVCNFNPSRFDFCTWCEKRIELFLPKRRHFLKIKLNRKNQLFSTDLKSLFVIHYSSCVHGCFGLCILYYTPFYILLFVFYFLCQYHTSRHCIWIIKAMIYDEELGFIPVLFL